MELKHMDAFGISPEEKLVEPRYKSKILYDKDIDNRFIPLSDKIFSKWMSDIPICSAFLTAVTGKKVNVTEVATEYGIGVLPYDSRNIRVDILAREGNFRIYNIDAQRRHLPGHRERCVFYTSRIVSNESILGSEYYSDFRPVTVIFINVDNELENEFLSSYTLRNDKTFLQYVDGFRIIEVNLDRLESELRSDKLSNDLKFFGLACHIADVPNMFEAKCKRLKIDFPDVRERLNSLFSGIKREYKIPPKSEYDSEEVLKVLSSRVFYEEGIEEGKEKGIAEGEERGIKKGEIKTALNFISEFLPLDMISKGTGLDISFLTELKNRSSIDLDSALSLYYELKR
jgi:predicted transposase/invertase (TIGR01784 family)